MAEARAGAAFLVAGFFFQATGTAGTHALDTAAAIVLLGLALTLIFYVAAGRETLIDAMTANKAASVGPEARPQLITSDRTPARQIEDLRPALAVSA